MSARESFDCSPLSVAAARRFVAEALHDAGVDTSTIVEAAQLAVSELATNAIEHAQSGFEVAVDGHPAVRISVTDDSPRPPQLKLPGPWGERGRGVALLATTASRWGVDAVGEGKQVWWEIDLPEVIVGAP